VTSCGRDSETALLAELMRSRLTISQIKKRLDQIMSKQSKR